MRIRLFLVLSLFCAQFILAQSAGNSGLSFLKIGVGARNIALGDNGTSMADDATSIFYNPANLSRNATQEVFIMHNQWIQDASSEVLGIKFMFLGLPVAIGINTTTIRGIDIRTTASVEKDGSFDAHYFEGTVATGFSITDQISGGLGIKYLYEGIYTDEADGIGFDAGITYKNLIPQLTLSGVIKNIGTMTQLRVERTKLPSELKLGASFALPSYVPQFDFIAGAEFQKYLTTDEAHANLGLEAQYEHMFAIRLGYMTNYEGKGFTGGIGIIWHSLAFDYAFTPFSNDLGSAHTFSLKIGL